MSVAIFSSIYDCYSFLFIDFDTWIFLLCCYLFSCLRVGT